MWLLARLPREYIIVGERISPYLVFSNSHDGSGAVRVALTPVRIVCNNTLNLALEKASRSWAMIHTGNINSKIQEAEDTLFMAEKYMDNLGKEFERLQKQKITVSKQDVGTFGMSEKEKSQASDSFKRACFNWGIGRKLYTAPFMFARHGRALTGASPEHAQVVGNV